MTDEHNLVRWSEALAGIARTGLAFTENLYERERYEEVLNVAADIQSHLSGADQPEKKIDEWMRSVGEGIPGYVTPKIAIGAVVGNDDEELLPAPVRRRPRGGGGLPFPSPLKAPLFEACG